LRAVRQSRGGILKLTATQPGFAMIKVID